MPQSLVLELGSGLDALCKKQTNKQTNKQSSGVAGDDDVRSDWGCVAAVDGSPQVAEPLEGRACERAVEEDVGGVGNGGGLHGWNG